MPRKPRIPPPPRKRRTADEARTAILDAAERRLQASGPAAIRLQEVAADVGVSHPTILHHFGSREALVEEVVRRALDSLHAGLMASVKGMPDGGVDQVAFLLDAVFETLAAGRHGRTFLWLALAGYAPAKDLRVWSLAEAVHAVRCGQRDAKRGKGTSRAKKELPTFEDTYFTVLLPALALMTLSVVGVGVPESEGAGGVFGAMKFRKWLAGVIHEHLENG
jgi:AcrR family transcriptional regulator